MSSRRVVPMNYPTQSHSQHRPMQMSKHGEESTRRKRGHQQSMNMHYNYRNEEEIEEEENEDYTRELEAPRQHHRSEKHHVSHQSHSSNHNHNHRTTQSRHESEHAAPQRRKRGENPERRIRKLSSSDDEEEEEEEEEEDDEEEESGSEDSDDSEKERAIQQKKKAMQQVKQKEMIVQKSKKLIGQQEEVIGSLNTKLHVQTQNLSMLNKENEHLRNRTDKLEDVEQEKKVMGSQLAAQKERAKAAKQVFSKRQSMLINHKADNFDSAFKKKRSQSSQYLLGDFGSKVMNALNSIVLKIESSYFLSRTVYEISNAYGFKAKASFALSAYFVNISLFGVLICAPFIALFVLSAESIAGIDDLLLHQYPTDVGVILAITLVVFALIHAIVLTRKFYSVKQREVSEDAKQGRNIQEFKLVFSRWNWRTRGVENVQKNQQSLLMLSIDSFLKTERDFEKYEGLNPRWIQVLSVQALTVLVMVVLLAAPYMLTKKRFLLDVVSGMAYIGEIVHGAGCAFLAKICAGLLVFMNQYEEVLNMKVIFRSRYSKLFFAQLLPAASNLVVAYSTFLGNSDLDSDALSIPMDFVSATFVCREQQVAHFIIGLVIGQFVVHLLWRLIPIMFGVCRSTKRQSGGFLATLSEFDMMESSTPMLIQNMLLLCLMPFTPFAILIALLMFSVDFGIDYMLLKYWRLPQHSGASKSFLSTQFIFYYTHTLVFAFCAFSLFFTKLFTNVNQVGSTTKYCNPFYDATGGASLFDSVVQSLRSKNDVIRSVYDSLTWFPVIVCLLFVYFVSYMVSTTLKALWRKEIQGKKTDISGIKVYYEDRIKRLESRIKEAKDQLSQISSLHDDDDDDNHSKEVSVDLEKESPYREGSTRLEDGNFAYANHKKTSVNSIENNNDMVFSTRYNTNPMLTSGNSKISSHYLLPGSTKNANSGTLKDISEESFMRVSKHNKHR